MRQIHWAAICSDCDKKWYSKNAMGVAANHYKNTGHEVYVEIVCAHYFGQKELKYNEAQKRKEDVI